MNDLKQKHQQDVESGYPEPWKLWRYQTVTGIMRPCTIPIHQKDWECTEFQRISNADELILEWQKKKYTEDTEWHPRPWELWEGRYKEDSYFIQLSNEPNDWKQFQCAIKFDGSLYYRRRPDAPTREQWEAAQKGEKMSIPTRAAAPRCVKKADKCATCCPKYEPKSRTIHVRMKFPDGKLYEADLPEPMREAPKNGDPYYVASNIVQKCPWMSLALETRMLAAGLCHRTKADAEEWLDFYRQWRSDK